MAKGLAARLVFLAALAGGLLLWAQHRRPRDLTLQIDLTGALPGEIVAVEVVVRRAGHLLARHDVRYGGSGAPGLVEFQVHAAPGGADVETTLVYAGRPARRSSALVDLEEDAPTRIRNQSQ